MREIKFRCWFNGINEMGLVTNLKGSNTGYLFDGVVAECQIDGRQVFYEAYSNFILMQYTGLKDRNGKEIYEGDIIKLFHGHPSWIINPFDVVFMNGAFALKQPDRKGSTSFAVYLSDCLKEGIIIDDGDDSLLFEVIGNIYEHPNLIQ
jgi:uncharacterized phage protein (TIGR01671 family)